MNCKIKYKPLIYKALQLIKTFLSLVFILGSFAVFGQKFVQLSGKVKDKQTLQLLSFTKLELWESGNIIKEGSSKQKAEFKFDSLLPHHTYLLKIHHSRYFDEVLSLQLENDTFINVYLCPWSPYIDYFPYVGFDFNQSSFKSNYQDSLWGLIETLKSNQTLVIGIIGYRDSSETEKDIVQKRMLEVKKYLIQEGIHSNRLVMEKSHKPNRNIFSELIIKNCEYYSGHELLTESYLLSIPDKKIQEELRSMNRWVWFKVLSDDYKK